MNPDDTSTDHEYDQRQYRRMEDTILAFEQGKLQVGTLITNLEALLKSVRSIDPTWRDQFQHEWGKIEDAFAYALDQGASELNSESKNRVQGALIALKRLIALQLGGGHV